jgi:ribosome-associated protein
MDDGHGQEGGAASRQAVLRVAPSLAIPLEEITWRATTSGGPGGQHANRTASRVEVRFDVERSASLGPLQRARLLERYGPVVRASAAEQRSQAANREIALARLAQRIASGLRVPRRRRPTSPTAAARARRLEDKRHRSMTKARRRVPQPGED